LQGESSVSGQCGVSHSFGEDGWRCVNEFLDAEVAADESLWVGFGFDEFEFLNSVAEDTVAGGLAEFDDLSGGVDEVGALDAGDVVVLLVVFEPSVEAVEDEAEGGWLVAALEGTGWVTGWVVGPVGDEVLGRCCAALHR